MSNDTVAIALELYTLKAGQPRAYAYSYERNTEAEKVIELARRIGYITDRLGHYRIIREDLAAEWNGALSALDRRDGR